MAIVAAVDGSAGSTAVLDEATTLANRFDEPLHAVFVYERSEHSHLAYQHLEEREPDSEVQVQQIAHDVIDEAAEPVTDEYEVVGRRGEPAEEILEYADQVDARYVVIGGRSRSPVGKALFGSVTQSVLLEADRPVVAVMEKR